jgi:predicted nucleic acid-binding Zn ribbon protein
MDKSNRESNIKDIIDDIFKKSRGLSDFRIIKLKRDWKKIIGDQMYKHTFPVRIEKTTLIINCDHQGWINTLQFYKKELLENIKKSFNDELKITEVKFYFGKRKYSH